MGIKVTAPGALTTVQDSGRTGLQQYGIPVCGAMDQRAFRAANLLCGNDESAAVLEMTLMGGTFTFTADHVIALTGADMKPRLNGEDIENYKAFAVHEGDTLELGMAAKGCRCYLAAAGGIDVPVVMGSRSTDLKSRTGGYQGRSLKAGDVLEIGRTGTAVPESSIKPQIPDFPRSARIRVIEGPQEYVFTAAGLETFYKSTYTLTDKCDRMGYRLSGQVIETRSGSDIISDGIVFGSIQVPSSGQPIILMADRQTTGGYAKIATVCSFDLPVLAQMRPGDTVTFEKIVVEDAQRIASVSGL